jgi:hypothetical protein
MGVSTDPWLAMAGSALSKVTVVEMENVHEALVNSDVLLGAGSMASLSIFLKEVPTTKPVLLFTTGDAGRRLAFAQQRRITHSSVGGVTTWQGAAWSRNWKMKDWPATVRRDIGHVLVHSDIPRACAQFPSFPHLRTDQLYPLDGLDLPVVFHSFGTYTNWGRRKLSYKELGYAMDLPVWVVSDKGHLQTWLVRYLNGLSCPLKPIQVATQLLLHSRHPGIPYADSPTKTPPLIAIPMSTFLPKLGCTLPNAWATTSAITATAVKSDNAHIATEMWDQRVSLVLPWSHVAMAGLRKLAFGYWQRRIRRGFQKYMRSTYGESWLGQVLAERQQTARLSAMVASESRLTGGETTTSDNKRTRSQKKLQAGLGARRLEMLLRDAESGCQTLTQVLHSTWWEWKNGSGLLFWRWNKLQQRQTARDGMEIFVQGVLPGCLRKLRPVPKLKIPIIAPKIGLVRKRGYIRPGPIQSFTDFFDVPKGDDVRMVYNGTSLGLNDALWAPLFYLPTADAAGRLLSFSSFCVDLDLGEMFLNFPMDPKIRPFTGVDLTQLAPHFEDQVGRKSNGKLFERWEHLFMGMRPSPYNAVRYVYWAEEFARGNPSELENAMGFDEVILNLPGDPKFDPTLPMVMKWNNLSDAIAGDVITFADDLRASGPDSESAWQVDNPNSNDNDMETKAKRPKQV